MPFSTRANYNTSLDNYHNRADTWKLDVNISNEQNFNTLMPQMKLKQPKIKIPTFTEKYGSYI